MENVDAGHIPAADAPEMPQPAGPLALDRCLEHINRIYVRHDAILKAWKVLSFPGHRLRELSTGYIVGHSRCGKSETIKRFIYEKTGVEQRDAAPSGERNDVIVRYCEGKGTRIVFADMTNGATPRIASRMILKKAFNDIKGGRAGESEGAVRLVEFLTQQKVHYFIVDEAQQMFRGHGPNALDKMGSWLLPLENAAAFSTKIVGGPELEILLEEVVAANLRKGGYCKLMPFDFKTEEQKTEFFSFVQYFARQMPFDSSCLLNSEREFKEEMLFPMYFATRGIPGEMAKLCETATAFAADSSPDCPIESLMLQNFADAFDFYLLHDHRMAGFNPFRSNGKEPPSISYSFEDEAEKQKENKRVGKHGRNGRGGRLWDT